MSDWTKLLKELVKQGFRCERPSGRHWKIYDPSGRLIATIASSCGGGRGFANAISVLRRGGFVWQGR